MGGSEIEPIFPLFADQNPQQVMPAGDFMLPICTNRDKLVKLLSVLREGTFLAPATWDSGEGDYSSIINDHIHDVELALGYIQTPELSPCFPMDCAEREPGCEDFLPHDPLITYTPNDPFRTPELVPEGYIFPPWYNNPLIPLPGVIATDAMVNLLGLPTSIIPLPASGLPTATIRFSGTGELEIEFVQILNGGQVMIVPDGDISKVEFIDMTSVGVADILSLGFILAALGIETDAAFVNTTTHEMHFDTPGLHEVVVTFLPNIDIDSEFLIGFGGGIRRVSLCGLTNVSYFELRQNPEDECQLEQRNSPTEEWRLAFDYGLCLPGAGVQQPTNETYPEGGGKKQVSYDNEETWQDAPYDERFDGSNPASYLTNARCAAAENLVAWTQYAMGEILAALDTASSTVTVIGVAVLILSVLFTGGVALPLVAGLISYLAIVGYPALVAALNEDFYETLVCEILCLIPEDGVITPEVYGVIRSKMFEYPGVEWEAIGLLYTILGPVGLNRAAHAGGISPETADCEDCGDCAVCDQPIVMEYGTIISSNPALGEYVLESENVSGSATISYYYGNPEVNTDCCFINAWENVPGYASTHHTARQVCGQDLKVNLQVLTNTQNHWVRWSRPTPDVMRVVVHID